jgi:propionate CoA-transferase
VQGGRLHVLQEGRVRKFVKQVLECTFDGPGASGRDILYVTERAVFRLLPGGGGLELLEVAPGIDVQRQVLGLMDFAPRVAAGGPRLMDPRLFQQQR